MELVAGRGVAAKVEADLAGPVIVAGPRTYEPELTGDLSQPCPVLAVLFVVINNGFKRGFGAFYTTAGPSPACRATRTRGRGP